MLTQLASAANETAFELPGIITAFVAVAKGLTGFFKAAGTTFLDNMLGILPMALIALTVLNAVVSLVGEERFDNFAQIDRKLFYPIYYSSVSWKLLCRKPHCIYLRPLSERKV